MRPLWMGIDFWFSLMWRLAWFGLFAALPLAMLGSVPAVPSLGALRAFLLQYLGNLAYGLGWLGLVLAVPAFGWLTHSYLVFHNAMVDGRDPGRPYREWHRLRSVADLEPYRRVPLVEQLPWPLQHPAVHMTLKITALGAVLWLVAKVTAWLFS